MAVREIGDDRRSLIQQVLFPSEADGSDSTYGALHAWPMCPLEPAAEIPQFCHCATVEHRPHCCLETRAPGRTDRTRLTEIKTFVL